MSKKNNKKNIKEQKKLQNTIDAAELDYNAIRKMAYFLSLSGVVKSEALNINESVHKDENNIFGKIRELFRKIEQRENLVDNEIDDFFSSILGADFRIRYRKSSFNSLAMRIILLLISECDKRVFEKIKNVVADTLSCTQCNYSEKKSESEAVYISIIDSKNSSHNDEAAKNNNRRQKRCPKCAFKLTKTNMLLSVSDYIFAELDAALGIKCWENFPVSVKENDVRKHQLKYGIVSFESSGKQEFAVVSKAADGMWMMHIDNNPTNLVPVSDREVLKYGIYSNK